MLNLTNLLFGTAFAQTASDVVQPVDPQTVHYMKYLPLVLLVLVIYFVFIHKKK